MCGTTMPTHPTMPQMLTETTVIRVEARMTTALTSPTFTPRAAASSLPADRALME